MGYLNYDMTGITRRERVSGGSRRAGATVPRRARRARASDRELALAWDLEVLIGKGLIDLVAGPDGEWRLVPVMDPGGSDHDLTTTDEES